MKRVSFGFRIANVMSFERPEIIRPPSEAGSYFLPLTSGCSNNSCGFCNYYGCKLKVRDLDEVKEEIDALALFVRHGVRVPNMPYIVYAVADEWDGRRVFLQDGDALVYPYPNLKQSLEYLSLKFPELERVGSYATVQDILRLSVEQLDSLKTLKLGILYVGVESGDDEILREIEKGVDSQQIIEAGHKVKAAGIALSVTVILGLGGIEKSREHALATAKILTELDPEFAGALTLTLVPGTPMYEKCRRGEFSLISPLHSLEELKTIIEKAAFSNCFFSSMHASNYLSVRGVLPRDKAKMLAQLERVLSTHDASLLRPEFLRGL
jgi:radical SAM superfamily enzyme YgiQ (UPF0313 family)